MVQQLLFGTGVAVRPPVREVAMMLGLAELNEALRDRYEVQREWGGAAWPRSTGARDLHLRAQRQFGWRRPKRSWRPEVPPRPRNCLGGTRRR
jgi:hypothetical protein